MNAAVLSGVAAQRSALYWLLAEIFLTCPSQALVERLRKNLAGPTGDTDGNPFAAVRDALPEDVDAAAIDQLAIEYTRLFGAISPSYSLSPPYESVQRDTADPAELAANVSTYYSDAGFAAIDQAVPPDHLGVELKFMAMLGYAEMQEWQHNNTGKAMQMLGRQRNFLDDHVLLWVPRYLGRVHAQSRHDFFRVVASHAIEAVTDDRRFLEDMLAELDAA